MRWDESEIADPRSASSTAAQTLLWVQHKHPDYTTTQHLARVTEYPNGQVSIRSACGLFQRNGRTRFEFEAEAPAEYGWPLSVRIVPEDEVTDEQRCGRCEQTAVYQREVTDS